MLENHRTYFVLFIVVIPVTGDIIVARVPLGTLQLDVIVDFVMCGRNRNTLNRVLGLLMLPILFA